MRIISAYTIGHGHHFILSKSNSIERLLDVDDDDDVGVAPNREWQTVAKAKEENDNTKLIFHKMIIYLI